MLVCESPLLRTTVSSYVQLAAEHRCSVHMHSADTMHLSATLIKWRAAIAPIQNRYDGALLDIMRRLDRGINHAK